MKSNTKIQLSETDIQRLVSRAFGDVQLSSIREMTEGWFNTTYHIVLGDGEQQTVLKIGPPADADVLTYENDLLRAEVETMKLAATNRSIPVPRITFVDLSCSQLPYGYYFMDFIDDASWGNIHSSLTVEQNGLIEYQLGQITAQINSFKHDTFGYYASSRTFDNWPDAFHWMCELLFADARRYRVNLELSEQQFFNKLNEHREIFSEVVDPQLVHWDLWAGNIFVNLDHEIPEITGLIDFERTLWGDPLMESHLSRLGGIPRYMEGYGEDMFASQSQRLRRIFYNIYLHLIMIIEDGPRQYDDKRSVKWARARLKRDIDMLRHGDVLLDG